MVVLLLVRGLLSGEERLTEKQMFGGLGFVVNGNMAVAASGQGGMLVRVDPTDPASDDPAAVPMEMRGRALTGWLHVDDSQLDDDGLAAWVARGRNYARSLPPK